MADIFNRDVRSMIMSRVKSKNSSLELIIRKGLHRLGFRYQLHRKNLPGKPDLTFPKFQAVIFINGCFWHAHDCHLFSLPTTHVDFWMKKIESNRFRDIQNHRKCIDLGWKVLIIWGCALKGKTRRKHNEVIHTTANWLLYDSQSAVIEGKNS